MSPLGLPGVADAATVPVELEPVPAGQVLSGSPRWGSTALGEVAGGELGVWELTTGEMEDVEVSEIFVVLRGRAVVTTEDGERLELRPGTVGRLSAGMRNRWTVTEDLRKVYLAWE